MKHLLVVGVIFVSLAAVAQQGPTNSPLLDHLAGKWVMQGNIGKQAATHELDAQWVIQHRYLRFYEVSRDKNATRQKRMSSPSFSRMSMAKPASRISSSTTLKRIRGRTGSTIS